MSFGSNNAVFTYLESLAAFFSESKEKCAIEATFSLNPAAKDLIEAHGVPHVEVYALKVNGCYESLEYNIQDGDSLQVYPKELVKDVNTSCIVRDPEKIPKKFIADVNLGKLARLLRLMGIDTVYSNQMKDHQIVKRAVEESRAVLSRDLDLLKHGALTYGYWPRSDNPDEQIIEVLDYFELKTRVSPLMRCLECNGLLKEVPQELVEDRIPPRVKQWNDEYWICGGCGKVYWQGSHYIRLKEKVSRILKQAGTDKKKR